MWMSYKKKKVLVVGSAAQTKFNYKITEIVRESEFSENIDFLMIVTASNSGYGKYPFDRVFYLRKGVGIKESIKILLAIRKYDVIIFNGVFFKDFFLFVMSLATIGKKNGWVIWGGDIYRDFGLFRKICMRILSFKFLGLPIPQDMKVYKEKLGSFNGRVLDFWFPNSVTVLPEVKKNRKFKKKYKVMVGNSATETNQHINAFDKLINIKNQNFTVVLPLSYGSEIYRNYVVEQAKLRFGENRIKIISDFLPANEYVKVLSSMDFIVSNHNRQQGGQNILLALALGVPVLINAKNVFYDFLMEKNIEVNALDRTDNFEMVVRPSISSVKKVREIISEDYARCVIYSFFSTVISNEK